MLTTICFIETEDISKAKNLMWSLDLLGEKYLAHTTNSGPWNNYLDKLEVIQDMLGKVTTEYVLVTDSRDVLFYKGLGEIEQIYKKYYYHYDILFQAEDAENGDIFFRTSKAKRYAFADVTEHYRYMCSGLIYARTSVLKRFISTVIKSLPDMPDHWKTADQPAMEWCVANKTGFKVGIDSKCRIFQQMGMGENSGINFHLHFNRKFIKNINTGTEPCVFHGAGKAFLNQVHRIIAGKYP